MIGVPQHQEAKLDERRIEQRWKKEPMKRIANVVLLVGVLSTGFLLGHATNNFDKWWTPDNDALAAAPQNHKLLFENDQVRVLEVTVQPGVREPLHAHRYPSVMYYVSAAHMKEYSPGLPAADHPRKEDGAVVFLPIGPPHQMEDVETTKPLKAIRVELKNAR
jgi:predicted metal-dependent enzyme (double-stranded beta helix superfamily)